MSNLGTPDRQLWYQVNIPKEAEPLEDNVLVKFLFGDILEHLLLFLAEEAGHTVEGVQDELEIDGVLGHRDAVIDGVLVDLKSASTYSYQKFQKHLTPEEDSFGYLDQLGAYLYASQDDPIVKDKNRAAFLVIDKTLGNICLDIHPKRELDYKKEVENKRRILESETPPERCFEPVPEGLSGNLKLGTRCSYCRHKHTCHPNLRTFLYAKGPVFLTKVEKTPKVIEVDRNGKYVEQPLG